MKHLVLLAACTTMAACSAHLPSIEVSELDGLRTAIQESKDAGAEKCAPSELANAEVKLLLAAHEIDEGGSYNQEEASSLIDEAMKSTEKAKAKCNKSKSTTVVKEKPAPVTIVKPKASPVAVPIAKPTVEVEPSRGYTDSEVIDLKGINFESNKAALTSSSKSTLDKAVSILKARKSINVEVAAHSDSGGKASYNEYLSGLRANAVKDYLISHGIDASRVTAKGYGETYPIADNKTRAGRAENRRVELIVK